MEIRRLFLSRLGYKGEAQLFFRCSHMDSEFYWGTDELLCPDMPASIAGLFRPQANDTTSPYRVQFLRVQDFRRRSVAPAPPHGISNTCCPFHPAGGAAGGAAGGGDPARAAVSGNRRQQHGAPAAAPKSGGRAEGGEGRRGWAPEAKRQGTPPAGQDNKRNRPFDL